MPRAAPRMATRDRYAGRYQRHRPEQTLLYRIVDEYYPAFTAHLAEQGRGNKFRVTDEPPAPAQRRASISWAQRLKRVFTKSRRLEATSTSRPAVPAAVP